MLPCPALGHRQVRLILLLPVCMTAGKHRDVGPIEMRAAGFCDGGVVFTWNWYSSPPATCTIGLVPTRRHAGETGGRKRRLSSL